MATMYTIEDEEIQHRPRRSTEAGAYVQFDDYTSPHNTDFYWQRPCEPQLGPDAPRAGLPPTCDVLGDQTERIQLLRILPSNSDEPEYDPPRILRENFQRHYAPPYIALSYTWGPPDCRKHDIIINGHRRPGIYDNLYSFLCYFRNDPANTESTYIWTDRLCIDFTSKVDRSYTVKFMSAIYTNATSVISWLGASHSMSDSAERVNKRCAGAEDFDLILQDVYFTRLWIVQELLLASKVYFMIGNTWLSLQDLERSIHKYGTHYQRNSPAYYLIFDSLHHTPSALAQLIFQYKGQHCGQPRDRVYALLGLAKENNQIEIDYYKPVTTVLMDTLNILMTSPNATYAREADDHWINIWLLLAAQMGISERVCEKISDQVKNLNVAPSLFGPGGNWFADMSNLIECWVQEEDRQNLRLK